VAEAWRIDELASRSGESVDTIRYWQRQQLLEPPLRVGRTVVYGPAHLERLARVRQLQARHLSLAAIRSLLTNNRGTLADTLFDEEQELDTAELATEAGVDPGLVHRLVHEGIVTRRGSYNSTDLRVVLAVRQLLDLGLPERFVTQLAAIYSEGFKRMHARVLTLFTTPGTGTVADLEAVQDLLAEQVTPALQAVESLLISYHQRAVQGMTGEAIDAAERADSGG